MILCYTMYRLVSSWNIIMQSKILEYIVPPKYHARRSHSCDLSSAVPTLSYALVCICSPYDPANRLTRLQ